MSDEAHQLGTEFRSESGEVVTFRQIGYKVRYESPAVETMENGFVIGGERYKRI